jgi:MFS family permease
VIYGLMIMAAGCSVIGLALATNTTGMVISMLVYGLGSGAWFLMVPLLLSEYLGVERIGSSYGLIRLFQALSNLIGPVIGGVLSDQTGSFAASFVVMGIIMNLGAVVVFLKPIIERKKKSDDSQMSDKQGCAE